MAVNLLQEHIRLAIRERPYAGDRRKLSRVGKSVEHVSADVVEQVKQDETEKTDLAAKRKVSEARKNLREIHKNLAAHEVQQSLLQQHVLKQAAAEPKLPEKVLPEVQLPETPTKKAS